MSVEATHAPVTPARRHDPMPASLLGVILFVASECVFFAALFGAYFTVRAQATQWPPEGIEPLEPWPLAASATVLLLLSSVTMQFAIWAIRRGDRTTMLRFLKMTLVLGVVFLGLQAYDYATLPFSISDTSVEVPPMSKVMLSEKPESAATFMAPTTPVAGPESTVRTACSRAVANDMTPPFDWVMCRGPVKPAASSRGPSRSM